MEAILILFVIKESRETFRGTGGYAIKAYRSSPPFEPNFIDSKSANLQIARNNSTNMNLSYVLVN